VLEGATTYRLAPKAITMTFDATQGKQEWVVVLGTDTLTLTQTH
jgi:hypothetical protein